MRKTGGPAYRKIHTVSNKIEPRMAKALRAAADRIRDRIPFREIEDALWQKDLRAVRALLDDVDVSDAYVPSSVIVEETVITGGKVASG